MKTSDFAVGMEVEVRGGGNETWYGEVTKVRPSTAKCPLEVAWLQKEGSSFIYHDCAHKDVIELRTVLETHEAGYFAVPRRRSQRVFQVQGGGHDVQQAREEVNKSDLRYDNDGVHT